MKTAPLLVLFITGSLVACGCGDGSGSGSGLQDDGPLLCPAEYISGRGNVWRGADPHELSERDIPCLQGDGSLRGYYLDSITASRGDAAYSAENRFFYDTTDDRLNQVEAYYVISHMANWIVGYFIPSNDYGTTLEMIRADKVHLYFDRPDVESKQLCYSLELGMQGVSGSLMNVDVSAHEFGHHLIFSLNRQIANSMIHEAMADFLAACFTSDTLIEPSQWPGFDRNLQNDNQAPEDIITKGAYCDLLLSRMEQDGIDQVYKSLAQTFADCRAQDPQEPEPHWASMILSGALWDLRAAIGESDFLPALFSALHRNAVSDTGDLMQRLIEADQELNAGANENLIENTFAERGIDHDLGLDFPDIPYPQCP
ncbi:MAG TPA: hypothetical protein VM425_19070 [Myxococcota bacterium]|nr:hypothetical protein [Myxococcota bacterium]